MADSTTARVRPLAEDVELTAMAVRETLMDYFGHSVARFTSNDRVYLKDTDWPTPLRHNYERRYADSVNRKLLRIGTYPLFTVNRKPDTVTFNTAIIALSPHFETIADMTRQFLNQYLPDVKQEDYHEDYIC